MRPERGGKLFSLDAIELLRKVWAGRQNVDVAHTAMLAAGYVLSRAQVMEGAKRYCTTGVVATVREPAVVGLPAVVEFNFVPRKREEDRVRLVPPGTHKAPAGGFSMLRPPPRSAIP